MSLHASLSLWLCCSLGQPPAALLQSCVWADTRLHLQLGLETRLAARARRSPAEFHAAAEVAEKRWGAADWMPNSRQAGILGVECLPRAHAVIVLTL